MNRLTSDWELNSTPSQGTATKQQLTPIAVNQAGRGALSLAHLVTEGEGDKMNALVAKAMEDNAAMAAAVKAQEDAARLARRSEMIECWSQAFSDISAVAGQLLGGPTKTHVWTGGDSYILVANGPDWRLTVDESYPVRQQETPADLKSIGALAEYFPARLTLDGLLGDIGVYRMHGRTYFLPLKATIEGRRIVWEARCIYDMDDKDGRTFAPDGLSANLVDAVAAVLNEAPTVRRMADELMAEIYAAESVHSFRIMDGRDK